MKLIYLFIFIFSLSFVLAGCCYDNSAGLCTQNADSETCTGEYSVDSSCSNNQDCDLGCCNIGGSVEYNTQRTCSIMSDAFGFQMNWRQTDNSFSCQQQMNTDALGACIFQSNYDTTCRFVSRTQCTGTFYENQLCSDSSFNTTCKKIATPKCFDNDAYYIDSCGNRDIKKEDCDYDAGTVCRINNQTKEAYCSNMNCGNRSNGDSWCVNEDPMKVGSRSFRQYCLNGEVITEPCGDLRAETCAVDNSSAKCVSNPWGSCIQDGNDLTELQNGNTNGYFNKSVVMNDSCDPEFCKVFSPASSNVLLNDMNLDMCVPKFSGGLRYWPQSGAGSSSARDMCAMGNYKGKTIIIKASSCSSGIQTTGATIGTVLGVAGAPFTLGLSILVGFVVGWIGGTFMGEDCTYKWGVFYSDPPLEYSNAGIFTEDVSQWEDSNWHGIRLCNGSSGTSTKSTGVSLDSSIDATPGLSVGTIVSSSSSNSTVCDLGAASKSIPPSQNIIKYLSERCQALGDCGSKYNLEEIKSGKEIYSNPIVASVDKSIKTYALDFTCTLFTATNITDDCTLCGKDGKPCTEYRCKSYGKKCNYYELGGIETGSCLPSTDLSSPRIVVNLSQNPVLPFTPLTITVNTDELSNCRFDVTKVSSTIDAMQYSVDEEWATEHKMTLTLPGKMPPLEEDTPQYALINRDGNYTLYLRCQDGAGNFNVAPYLVRFNVMQTPDNLVPTILSFVPSSDSPIKFNTTEKLVVFKINEPAECKWDSQNVDYTLMKNNFSCDTAISDDGTKNGYHCRGILTNVTTLVNMKTDFYIRCKDQPWLEGIEDNLYKRNTNSASVKYTLKPSLALNISDFTPSGELKYGGVLSGINITAKTIGGGENNRAVCKWKYTFNGTTTRLTNFSVTNLATHMQRITNISEGDYVFYVECTDMAGNQANKTTRVYLRQDSDFVKLSRGYNSQGVLKISTSEPSSCKFHTNPVVGCNFNFDSANLTLMTGKSNMEYQTSWMKGKTYYIKCKDLYGNTNDGCSLVVKAES